MRTTAIGVLLLAACGSTPPPSPPVAPSPAEAPVVAAAPPDQPYSEPCAGDVDEMTPWCRAIFDSVLFDALIESDPPGATVYQLHGEEEAYEYIGETPSVSRQSRKDLPVTVWVGGPGFVDQPVVIDGRTPRFMLVLEREE